MNFQKLMVLAQASKGVSYHHDWKEKFEISNAVMALLMDAWYSKRLEGVTTFVQMDRGDGPDLATSIFAVVGFETDEVSIGFPLPKVEKGALAQFMYWADSFCDRPDYDPDDDGEDRDETVVDRFISENNLLEVENHEEILWGILFEEVSACEISSALEKGFLEI